MTDLYSKRLELAKQSKSDIIVDPKLGELDEAIHKIWPHGADIVVDTTGSSEVVQKAARAVRQNGKMVLLGWIKGSEFTFESFHGRIFEALLPWGLYGERVSSAWRLMDSGALKVEHLITHRFNYSDAQSAYDLIFASPDQYTGIVLDWGEH